MTITPNIEYATLTGIAEAIAAGETSSAEVTGHILARIERLEPKVHAFAHICADSARAQAKAADAEIARGFRRGPLHGVPVAIKDLIHTADHPTEAGMRIHNGWIAPEDSTIVARLKRAGAVIVGKTELTEGATLVHHPDRAAPLNPWDPGRGVGFSSSGSGAAVAAGFCYAALGSDTGGSIRIPAAMNGTTGLKPTWGRVTRHGIFDLVTYLDTIGPLARSAADAAAMLGVIAGADPKDPTAAPVPVPDYLAEIGHGIGGVRIGLDLADLEAHCDPQVVAMVRETAAILADLGALIRPATTPALDMGPMFGLFGPGIADIHRDTYPSRAADYGPGLKGLIDHGASVAGRDVAAGITQSNILKGELATLFTGVDLLLVPALARPTPRVGEVENAPDMAPMFAMLRYCGAFNISGHPTITLRGGTDANAMPIAFQLVARPFEEDLLFRAGHAWQGATDWHTRHPGL
jgi:amidase